MALQVCEYPKCKTITLLNLCEEHRHEEFDDDEPIPTTRPTLEERFREGADHGRHMGDIITVPRLPLILPHAKPEPPVRRPTEDDDLVQEILRAASDLPPRAKKETVMTGKKCSKKTCPDDAAENSVMCAHHRDIKARSNANYQGRPTDVPKPKRKYTFRTRKPKVDYPAVMPAPQLPAKRANAPIVLAEPTHINPPTLLNGNGHGSLSIALDALIAQREEELVMLRGTKEIMERSHS